MGKTILDLSISLDGYTAGEQVGVDFPLGKDGERLHDWMFDGRSAQESEQFEEDHFRTAGALIMGRRTLDLGIGPWGDNPTFHAPCFVVTNRPHPTITKSGGTSYNFVTEGIHAAAQQARSAAGDQDVILIGGADTARQFINAALLDEIRLHLVPIILTTGTRLFHQVNPALALHPTHANPEPLATHLTYQFPQPR